MFQIILEHPLVIAGAMVAGALMSESIRRLANKLSGGVFFGKKQA